MSAIDEPTLGEVLRRIDTLTQQVSQLVAELKQDRADAARTYMRQDVYMAERTAQQAMVADLHRSIAKVEAEFDAEIQGIKDGQRDERTGRRQVWLAVGTCAVTSLLTLAGLIVTIVRG